MKLRPYQFKATQAAKEVLRRSSDPVLIDAAPASGKSYMVADLALWLHEISNGKRVLALAPNKSLVKQNVEKYLLTGEKCSIFSASAGQKSLRHPVVYGTPLTVKNAISKFKKGFCAVIVDEAHGMTPTIRAIIEEMRETNPNLRVIGLTGTPYVLNHGYIFREWPYGKTNGEDTARDPYFVKCVYRISAREMLDGGYITPMRIGQINAEAYDTSGVQLLPNGTLNPETVDRAFVGYGRKTAGIVSDVLRQAFNIRGGVMFFAATVRHAEEILASLPPENSALSTGDKYVLFGRESSEDAVIKAYREGSARYLVNVDKHTTGFDVSHTAVIALLRYTESAALLQQILGRAWRLDPDKPFSLLLDFADNLDRHFPDGDIFNPEIKAGAIGGAGEGISVSCPECGYVNEAKVNPDYTDYQYDQYGYALDVFGEPMKTEYGPVPVHYTRRCWGVVGPEYTRCGYYWTSKECESCGEKNDISARYCAGCRGELVDPNERLVSEFRQLKRDPTKPQTDEVVGFEAKSSISARGNQTIRVDVVTPYRSFSVWIMAVPKNARQQRDLALYNDATRNGIRPATVTYCKDADSGFYRIIGYNAPADEAPEGYEKGKRK